MQQQMSKTEVVDDNDNLAADNSVHAFWLIVHNAATKCHQHQIVSAVLDILHIRSPVPLNQCCLSYIVTVTSY